MNSGDHEQSGEAEEDYLRLPKGFQVRETDYFDVFVDLQTALRAIAASHGYRTLLLPAVGFAKTFARGADTTGEKTYTFLDRGGRQLMLAPDSTPALLRWYLDTNSYEDPAQACWLAPLFRYRNVENRAFYQFGLTFINGPILPNALPDLELVEATNFILRLYAEYFGSPLVVAVTNVGAIRDLLSILMPGPGRTGDFLSELQGLKSPRARVSRVLEICPDQPARDALVVLLGADRASLSADVDSLLQRSYQPMNAISCMLHGCVRVELSPGDLHSSQTLNGLGVRFKTSSGAYVGDGGRYDVFGRNYHGRLRSVVSACSGVEALYRATSSARRDYVTDFAIITFPESALDAFAIAEELRRAGINVRLSYIAGSVKKAVARAAAGAPVFTLIGTQEVERKALTIGISQSNERRTVPLSELVTCLQHLKAASAAQTSAVSHG